MTWSGREVATASFTSGIEEVLEARIASWRVTTWSSTWKISVLTCSFSTTASIDQIAVGELAEVGGEAEPRQRRVALLLGDLAAFGGLGQGVEQPGAADLQGLAGGLGDLHVQAGAGAHLGDARAHLAAAHHSDACNVCRDVRHIVPFADLTAAAGPPCSGACSDPATLLRDLHRSSGCHAGWRGAWSGDAADRCWGEACDAWHTEVRRRCCSAKSRLSRRVVRGDRAVGARGVGGATAAGPPTARRRRTQARPRRRPRELRGMWVATVANRDWPSEAGPDRGRAARRAARAPRHGGGPAG